MLECNKDRITDLKVMKRSFLFFALAAILLVPQSAVQARSTGWEIFQSETGAYELYLPDDKHTKETHMLRLSPDFVVYSENVMVRIDQRPFMNVVKSHIIKLDQTWGTPLSANEKETILKYDMRNYEQHYAKKGAVVIDQSFGDGDNNLRFGELKLVYNDDELGPQSVRARVLVNSQSKIQQILVGPDKLIDSKWSNDFFDYMHISDGMSKKSGEIGDDWKSYTPDMNLFTMQAPPVAEPYVKEEVDIVTEKNHEAAHIRIFDPVRLKKMDYTVHGYTSEDVWTFAKVRDLLLDEFVVKYLKSPAGLQFDRALEGAIGYMEVNFSTVNDDKKSAQKEHVRLRVTFAQNYLIVQELKGVRTLTASDLAKNLFSRTVFHPEEAHSLTKQ